MPVPEDTAALPTIELRRWAVVQAQLLVGKGGSVDDLIEVAENIEEWVLRDPEAD